MSREPRDPQAPVGRADDSAEPDEWRLLMMGFLDGELDDATRRRFVERCYEDPELAAELARYRRLVDVADSMRLREPSDDEYERFFQKVGARIERSAGFVLLAIGAVVVVGWALVALFRSDLDLALKIGLGVAVAGFALLVSSVVRVRRRLRRLDRYLEVRR